MFVVEARRGRGRPWIAGVAIRRDRATRLLRDHGAIAGVTTRLLELTTPRRYPLFVIEDDQLRYGDLDQVRAWLRARPAVDVGADEILCNLYVVRAAFSSEPGRDAMGALPHWHLGAHDLRGPRAAALLRVLAQELGAMPDAPHRRRRRR